MKNYLKDGNLKIDNNLAENAIRPLTVGENLKYHAAFLSSACLEKYSRIWNENGNT